MKVKIVCCVLLVVLARGVTASAVNQHLRVLRDAGLLVSTRYGRSVLYLRSELGSALLEARAG